MKSVGKPQMNCLMNYQNCRVFAAKTAQELY